MLFGDIFALLEGYISNKCLENTYFYVAFGFLWDFRGDWFNMVAMATLIFQSTFEILILLSKSV